MGHKFFVVFVLTYLGMALGGKAFNEDSFQPDIAPLEKYISRRLPMSSDRYVGAYYGPWEKSRSRYRELSAPAMSKSQEGYSDTYSGSISHSLSSTRPSPFKVPSSSLSLSRYCVAYGEVCEGLGYSSNCCRFLACYGHRCYQAIY